MQPTNAARIALVEAVGIHEEGFSRRYVKHRRPLARSRRFAMLAEDWRRCAGARVAKRTERRR